MKNKDAKSLMLGSIVTCKNGECSILNRISIRGDDLQEGATLSFVTYIGTIDEPKVKSEIRAFCKKLGLSKSKIEEAVLAYPKEYESV